MGYVIDSYNQRKDTVKQNNKTNQKQKHSETSQKKYMKCISILLTLVIAPCFHTHKKTFIVVLHTVEKRESGL